MTMAALPGATGSPSDAQIDAAVSTSVDRCGTFDRMRHHAIHRAAGGRAMTISRRQFVETTAAASGIFLAFRLPVFGSGDAPGATAFDPSALSVTLLGKVDFRKRRAVQRGYQDSRIVAMDRTHHGCSQADIRPPSNGLHWR